jgi:hypothetical protein
MTCHSTRFAQSSDDSHNLVACVSLQSSLIDRLYSEFGHQPFTILLPNGATVSRGHAPLFTRGRSILRDILERFLLSSPWQAWALGNGLADTAVELVGAEQGVQTPSSPSTPQAMPKPKGSVQKQQQPTDETWDGWD